MYGSDSKADQFEIWIDSQYPFSDTDHNQASSVNNSVWVAGLYWLSKLNLKTCFYEWVSNNKSSRFEKICNPKNGMYVTAFTIEDSDLILRLTTSAICTSGWMFLIPRKGAILELKPNLDVKNTELL